MLADCWEDFRVQKMSKCAVAQSRMQDETPAKIVKCVNKRLELILNIPLAIIPSHCISKPRATECPGSLAVSVKFNCPFSQTLWVKTGIGLVKAASGLTFSRTA